MTLLFNPAALRKSDDPDGIFTSSLAQGRIDRAYENLEVRVLHAPNERDMRVTVMLGAAAHAGAFGDVQAWVADEAVQDPPIDLDSIGLQQVREAGTVTFLIYGCTRAFTHELVRTRKGAWFLQQTPRHTDMGKANVRMPASVVGDPDLEQLWLESTLHSVELYQELISRYVAYEDARTVLPLATETWIIAGMPVRTWLETYEYRACNMFYPEMRYVWQRMKEELAKCSPWLANQAKITCERVKECTYRGAEDTSWCPMPWSGVRQWRSPLYDGQTIAEFQKFKKEKA